MEDIFQEYGKVLLAILVSAFIILAISLSWTVIGDAIVMLNDSLAGGAH
jgi:hypothetical protein